MGAGRLTSWNRSRVASAGEGSSMRKAIYAGGVLAVLVAVVLACQQTRVDAQDRTGSAIQAVLLPW